MLQTRLLALAGSAFLGVAGVIHAQDTLVLTVDADQAGPVISRQIFGQFAEHLGRGIYEGVTVRGETLAAPKIDSVNTFEAPNTVAPKAFTAKRTGGAMTLELAPASVTVVALSP